MLRTTATAGLLALLTWGCTQGAGRIPVVRSEYWRGEDFAAYQRYAWLPSDAHRRQSTQLEDHRMHDLVREAVDEQLSAKGFVLGSPKDADFLVTYHCKIKERIQTAVIDRVWYGVGDEADSIEVTPRVEYSSFDEGSIVIDFVRAANGKRVWRGVARGSVSLDATPDELEGVVDRSVREILNEFPPPTP